MAGGGKTSTSTQSSPYAGALWAAGNRWQKTAFPLFSQNVNQAMQAMQTGGVNSQIPLINRAVDASRQAASTSDQSTRQSLARLGLTDTPFGQELLSKQQQQTGEQIAGTGPSIASNIASGAPGLISLGEGGFSPMSTAAGLDITSKQTMSPFEAFLAAQQMTQGLGGSLGSSFATGGASSGGTP